jgi:hypothetical protein
VLEYEQERRDRRSTRGAASEKPEVEVVFLLVRHGYERLPRASTGGAAGQSDGLTSQRSGPVRLVARRWGGVNRNSGQGDQQRQSTFGGEDMSERVRIVKP